MSEFLEGVRQGALMQDIAQKEQRERQRLAMLMREAELGRQLQMWRLAFDAKRAEREDALREGESKQRVLHYRALEALRNAQREDAGRKAQAEWFKETYEQEANHAFQNAIEHLMKSEPFTRATPERKAEMVGDLAARSGKLGDAVRLYGVATRDNAASVKAPTLVEVRTASGATARVLPDWQGVFYKAEKDRTNPDAMDEFWRRHNAEYKRRGGGAQQGPGGTDDDGDAGYEEPQKGGGGPVGEERIIDVTPEHVKKLEHYLILKRIISTPR